VVVVVIVGSVVVVDTVVVVIVGEVVVVVGGSGAVVVLTGGGAVDVGVVVVGWVTVAVVPGEMGGADVAGGDVRGAAGEAASASGTNGTASDPRTEPGANAVAVEVFPLFASAVVVVVLGSVVGLLAGASDGANGLEEPSATLLDWLSACGQSCRYAVARPMSAPPPRSTARKIIDNRRFSVMSASTSRLSSAWQTT
jgi:hypothetical protein